jgi:mono/diheme cytochrome c family protein
MTTWQACRSLALGAALLGLVSCRQDMHDQPKYEPLETSDFFADGQSSRPQVEGTVARGQLQEDEAFYRGRVGNEFVPTFPIAIDRPLLERGRQRFDIYCSPCHGLAGYGDGMIVKRGLRPPPSFHLQRLRTVRDGYLFDVITSGFGAMPDYRAQIPVQDRWAIVAYLRALQLSQHADVAEVPPDRRSELER